MGTIQPDPVRVILKCNGEQHICKLLPIGWREHATGWSFDFDGFGYSRKTTIDTLRFVKEDADFIRHCLDLYGISAEIDIIIQRRNQRWAYDDFFTGQIDISKGYTNEVDFIEVDVYEGGFKRALEKDNKTNFDIPFDEDAVDIHVPVGMQLKENVKYSAENTSELYLSNGPNNWFVGTFTINLNLDDANSNILTPILRFNTQSGFIGGQAAQTTLVPFLTTMQANQEVDITIPLKLKLKIKSKHLNSNTDISLSIFDVTNNNQIWRYYDFKIFKFSDLTIIDGFFVGDFNISASILFTITNDIKKYAIMFGTGNGIAVDTPYTGKDVTFDVEGNISFDFWSTANSGTFNFPAYKAEVFGQKLLDKIYPNATFEIPFLQAMETNENMQLFITSADAIRGIKPTDDQPQGALIKTNLAEFIKNISCLYDFGMQVDNTDNGVYTLKPKTEIFANTEILDLGEVTKMQTILPDEEWFANNIQVGYEKQEYDYPLGRQEFANTLELNNDIDILNQKMELVSKFRADYTGVHLLHFDYVNSDKKDSKSDNDIFWILAFKKQITNFKNVTGVPGRITDINVSVGQVITNPYQEICHIDDGSSFGVIIIAGTVGVVTEVNISVGQTITADTIIAVIKITTDEWQAIAGDRITAIDGLDGGGYFNILLSPKTMLMNHARFFSSILDKHAKILRYTSSTETMSALEYTDTELGHVVEKADLDVSNAVPFFKPIIFEFDCIIRHNLPEILGQNPAGYFKFRYNNLELKGFPLEVEGSTNDSVQTVKCIAHPDTPDNIQEILHKRLPNKIYK